MKVFKKSYHTSGGISSVDRYALPWFQRLTVAIASELTAYVTMTNGDFYVLYIYCTVGDMKGEMDKTCGNKKSS
jgi:hypothetical protein